MQTLARGQKMKCEALAPGTEFMVTIAAAIPGTTVDFSCFGVDEHEKLSDDRFFTFYNQKEAPAGAVRMLGPVGDDDERFAVALSKLPPTIKKLVFVMTIDGAGEMRQLQRGHWRLRDGSGTIVAQFPLVGSDYAGEKALITGELYFKDVWRLAAVGQGFNGGLSALLKHFGGKESPGASPSPTPAPKPTPAPPPVPPASQAPPPVPPGPSAPPPVPPAAGSPPPLVLPAPAPSAAKVTLDKRGDRRAVNLTKGATQQPIHINLNWDNIKTGGFLGMGGSAPDLDLGCMFRMKDGKIGVIQPLGQSFGSRTQPPYIYLDKDDRSGMSSDGENLYIIRPDLIDYVMVFALLYEGARDFAQVNARLTLKDQSGTETFIKLTTPDPSRLFCSICTIRNVGASVEITKEERYFQGHREADQTFGFGFRWVAGSK